MYDIKALYEAESVSHAVQLLVEDKIKNYLGSENKA